MVPGDQRTMKADAAPPELLEVLARATSLPGIHFAASPTAVPGGNETTTFAFRLDGVPADSPWAPELILRVFDPERQKSPNQPFLEAAVHEFLGAQGFPVPRVLHVHVSERSNWLIMQRLAGTPLGSDALTLPFGIFRIPSLMRGVVATMTVLRQRLHSIDPDMLLASTDDRNLEVPRLDYWLTRTQRRADETGGPVREALHSLMGSLLPWAASERLVICHYDFHPLNILAADKEVSGVIDWGGVTLAPREFDIANSIAVLTLASIVAPPVVRQVIESTMRHMARMFLQDAEPVDVQKVEELVALRALVELIPIMQRGPETADVGQWNVARLRAVIGKVTGVSV